MNRLSLFVLACCCLAVPAQPAPFEISLTDPAYGRVNASALDQPRLYALLSDPSRDNAFVTWSNPDTGQIEPVLLTVFVDTGASGFALSHLHAIGDLGVAGPAFAPADYTGSFTEIGIGGDEVGDVTRPFGVWISDVAYGTAEELSPPDFADYGAHALWVRRETGTGEYNDLLGADPINLVGMPAIRQRRLHLDLRPTIDLAPIAASLLPPEAPEPATQATVSLLLQDFVGEAAPSGETLPSHSANPLVPGIVLRHGSASATGAWLLDTGAGSSFASFALAKAVGLIPGGYATLGDFMATYSGPVAQIGGIGAARTVPILTAQRIELPTREGALLVWENVDLLVADVAGLDGIFGMNLLAPAVTIDATMLGALAGEGADAADLGSLYGLILALLFDISPAPFDHVIIDTTHSDDPVMRLATPHASGTALDWLSHHFTAAQRQEPSVGSFAGDPDGDGLPSLLEYALGLDPNSAEPSAARPSIRLVGPTVSPYVEIAYHQPSGTPGDVRCAVEYSEDLVNWRSDSAVLAPPESVADATGETITRRSTLPLAPGRRQFLRLVAEPTP